MLGYRLQYEFWLIPIFDFFVEFLFPLPMPKYIHFVLSVCARECAEIQDKIQFLRIPNSPGEKTSE